MTLTSEQLFEKLKVQESSADDESAKKLKAQEAAGKQPPAHHSGTRGQSRTESELSHTIKTKQDEHGVSLKARGPEVCQKKGTQTYGSVHSRHVNQLFIRGENIILVNPQPL